MKIEDIFVGQFLRVALTGEEAVVLQSELIDGALKVRVAKQTAQEGIRYVEERFMPFELETLEDNCHRTVAEIRIKARIFKAADAEAAAKPLVN